MEEKNNPIIEMTDNEGRTINAELFDLFVLDDQKYALLRPVYEEGEEHEDAIAVMRLMEDGDQYYIEEIATDEEWEKVQAALSSPCHCNGGCGEHKDGCCGEHKGNCDKEGCHCGE